MRNRTAILVLLPILASMAPAGGKEFSNGKKSSGISPSKTDGPESAIRVPDGFEVERIYQVPREQGSWVAVTRNDRGRLLCADQHGSIYEVTTGAEPEVRKLGISIGGAHGLLWHRGALYVSVNESAGGAAGVYRVTDADRDGTLEKIELIKKMKGRGEHGPHSLVASPDGEWIYFCAGNHTDLAEMDNSFVSRAWGEDQLLPRNPDARGHARDRMAPGGWISRFKPDGTRWELVAIGFRNQFDMAFNDAGDLFTYDADMEWDFGMPWYRPTRICQVIPGADFGWRNGTGKWPAYSEDSMPAALDLGPGSPTGLLSGKGAKFPARYQQALYALDWTFATIYAIHLRPDGPGYHAEREEFLSGKGLPLTDAVIGADGAMYFLTGGRKTASSLWRVRYTGRGDTSPAVGARKVARDITKEQALTGLGSPDRVTRQKARLILELTETSAPLRVTANGDDSWRGIGLAIIKARHQHPEEAFGFLTKLNWTKLDNAQRLGWLRAMGLIFIRAGKPDPAWREKVLGMIDASFPATDDILNRELCRMLSYLQAPGIVGRTLVLMDSAGPEPAPDWAELAKRNSQYGGTINKMLENQPPSQVIHYVYCLRCVKGPWAAGERQRFFTWIDRLKLKSGGASYNGFLTALRNDAIAAATPEEREIINTMPTTAQPNLFADLPPIKGPGRAWTVESVIETTTGKLEGRDRKNGSNMFRASLCYACHRFGGEGGAVGPDLTAVSGRFGIRELAEAIINPSREISDQYHFEQFIRKDGSQVVGRQIDEKDGKIIIEVNPFGLSQTTEVVRSELKERKPSPVSPMPAGLINSMNEEELRDLFAHLLGK